MPRQPKIEINRAKNKEFFVTIKGSNNKKILTSGETYKTKQGVKNAVKAAKKIIRNPKIIDNTL